MSGSSIRSVNSSSSSRRGLSGAFREKVKFIQTWKHGNVVSNRDKLELYALHKVAVNGDAPPSLPGSATSSERSKYNAWRSKSGKSKEEAMQLYLQEADRQIRVYGSTATPIPNDNQTSTPTDARTPRTTPIVDNTNHALPSSPTPRALAAIPLLCAAAAESRQAYLRRLSKATLETAWWVRQEALCAPPGRFAAFPESLLLAPPRFIEHITLTTPGRSLVGSFFWPLQKCFLVLWMLTILYVTVLQSSFNTLTILVWGTRRTGLSLEREWVDIIPLVAHSVSVICEPHQALTTRLVGLVLLPFASLINFLNNNLTDTSLALANTGMILVLIATWWYWLLTVPFLMCSLLWIAFWVGFCFVLIELAGV